MKKSAIGGSVICYTTNVPVYPIASEDSTNRNMMGTYSTVGQKNIFGKYVSTSSSKIESYKALNAALSIYKPGY